MGCTNCGEKTKIVLTGVLRVVTPRGHSRARPRVFVQHLPDTDVEQSLVDLGGSDGVGERIVSVVKSDPQSSTGVSE